MLSCAPAGINRVRTVLLWYQQLCLLYFLCCSSLLTIMRMCGTCGATLCYTVQLHYDHSSVLVLQQQKCWRVTGLTQPFSWFSGCWNGRFTWTLTLTLTTGTYRHTALTGQQDNWNTSHALSSFLFFNIIHYILFLSVPSFFAVLETYLVNRCDNCNYFRT